MLYHVNIYYFKKINHCGNQLCALIFCPELRICLIVREFRYGSHILLKMLKANAKSEEVLFLGLLSRQKGPYISGDTVPLNAKGDFFCKFNRFLKLEEWQRDSMSCYKMHG
jgi:hypothetical protein